MGDSVANATIRFSANDGTWRTTRYTDVNGQFSRAPVEPETNIYIVASKGEHQSGRWDNSYTSPTAGNEGTAGDLLLDSTCSEGKGIGLIGHFGYDFSLSTSDSSVSGYSNDGMTNTWGCNDTPTTTGLFWCPDIDTALQFKDMGKVDLSTVTNTPTEWDSPVEALQLNHVYVVSAKDGYVKFKVNALYPNSSMWWAVVEYVYSSGSAFTN